MCLTSKHELVKLNSFKYFHSLNDCTGSNGAKGQVWFELFSWYGDQESQYDSNEKDMN